MSRPVIFFDLDGVLADFVGGVFRLQHPKPAPRYDDVRWGLEEQLGYADPADFWRQLGYEFWSELPAYEDGFGLLGAVATAVGLDGIGLLTSPCDTPGCLEGKRDWVRRHLPDYHRRLFIGSAKHLFAGPGKVLVDDHDANVDAFRAAGGRVVQPPRPWNRRSGETHERGSFVVTAAYTDVIAAVSLPNPGAA